MPHYTSPKKAQVEVPAASPDRPYPIPDRTSSLSHDNKKRKPSWDDKFSGKSTEDLNEILLRANGELSGLRKKLKRKVSMDEEYWSNYIRISELQKDQIVVKSQLELRSFEFEGNWHDQDEAKKMKLHYDSWSQYGSIMEKHRKRLSSRLNSSREKFLRLFSTSRVGLDLPGGAGTRSSSAQSNFVKQMLEQYYPVRDYKDYRWDPILAKPFHRSQINAAHLFPWRQELMMDEIFGKGARDEIFSPLNGLFLESRIEKALDRGLIAIVPDIDLEPANPEFPMDDQEERQDRIRDWEKRDVKDYKVIIIDKTNREVNHDVYSPQDNIGIGKLLDLHNRKLVFQTDFRPRARYVWWTFMNSILRTAWSQASKDDNVQHQEVRKATRYWGTRGRYVKQNQLLGFVEELGQDVESILDCESDDEEGDKEVGLHAVTSMVQEVITKSSLDDEEEEEGGEKDIDNNLDEN